MVSPQGNVFPKVACNHWFIYGQDVFQMSFYDLNPN